MGPVRINNFWGESLLGCSSPWSVGKWDSEHLQRPVMLRRMGKEVLDLHLQVQGFEYTLYSSSFTGVLFHVTRVRRRVHWTLSDFCKDCIWTFWVIYFYSSSLPFKSFFFFFAFSCLVFLTVFVLSFIFLHIFCTFIYIFSFNYEDCNSYCWLCSLVIGKHYSSLI